MASIYVGNLPYSITTEHVRDLFKPYGAVRSVNIIMNLETGRSRGYGFVEMDTDGASKAITALNQQEVEGRRIVVNEARPRYGRESHQHSHMSTGH